MVTLDLKTLDFVLTVSQKDTLNLYMVTGNNKQSDRLVPVALTGLVAKSILRDLEKAVNGQTQPTQKV